MATPGKSTPPAPALQGHDILYVLIRRRWLILFLSFLAVGAGVGTFFVLRPAYESEAQLLVKYVVDVRSMAVDGPDATVRTPGDRSGDAVLNSEIGIASSYDLAREVAQAVGPTNIVAGLPDGPEALSAATLEISRGLQVAPLPKSSILQLRFRHPNPIVARSVLTNLVAGYLRAHTRIHRSLDVLNELQREADQRRTTLEQLAADLRRIKNDLGVASVEEAKRAQREQMDRTRSEIFATETLLAEKRSILASINGFRDRIAKVEPVASTNATDAATNAPAVVVPSARLSEYRSVRIRLEELTRREQLLLLEYTELSPFVKAVREGLTRLEADRARLEEEFPVLPELVASSAARPGDSSRPSTPEAERVPQAAVEIPALEAKLKSLNAQLELVRQESLKLDAREEEMETLERKKQIEEKRYVNLVTAINQAGVDQQITQGRNANIRVIQEPTPAFLAKSKTLKTAGSVAGGGIAFALALAFALEWYVDRSVRRRAHVEEGLGVPLFLSIPRLRLPKLPRRKALPAPAAAAGGNGKGQLIPVEPDPSLAPYVEAIRDRLMMQFESDGVVHKPKLIGLTSCGHGAGVTTVATALAASLSETGDGNVLYVDMNPARGPSLHPFHRGGPKIALSQAFEDEGRAAAQVQENLFVVSINEPGAKRVGVVPKTLAALMPKMKASDYDYIIFDLPPVTQTSVTSKIVGVLDTTFFVVESERTQTALAKNALTLLGEGKGKISAVLNKHRRFLPESLDPDI